MSTCLIRSWFLKVTNLILSVHAFGRSHRIAESAIQEIIARKMRANAQLETGKSYFNFLDLRTNASPIVRHYLPPFE